MLFSRFYSAALLCLVLAGCSNEGDACFAMVKNDLKDPETASVIEWRSIPEPYLHITQVTIRATNSFGAYGRVYGLCYDANYRLTSDKDDISLAGKWNKVAK